MQLLIFLLAAAVQASSDAAINYNLRTSTNDSSKLEDDTISSYII